MTRQRVTDIVAFVVATATLAGASEILYTAPPQPLLAARVINQTPQSITPGAWNKLTFQAATGNNHTKDLFGMLSSSTLVIKQTGWYDLVCNAQVAATAGTARDLTITVGGLAFAGGTQLAYNTVYTNAAVVALHASTVVPLVAGDALECDFYTDGTSVATQTSDASPMLAASFLHP